MCYKYTAPVYKKETVQKTSTWSSPCGECSSCSTGCFAGCSYSSLERMLMAAVSTWELSGTGMHQAVLLALTCHGALQLCNRGSVRAASAPCKVKPDWGGKDSLCSMSALALNEHHSAN